MDTRGDKIKLNRTGLHILEGYHIDIQDLFKTPGGQGRDGMGYMASKIIDSVYADMKDKFPSEGHKRWEYMPLPKVNQNNAAIDGYLSFELCHRIKTINDAQLHLQAAPVQVICPCCMTVGQISSAKQKHPLWDEDGQSLDDDENDDEEIPWWSEAGSQNREEDMEWTWEDSKNSKWEDNKHSRW